MSTHHAPPSSTRSTHRLVLEGELDLVTTVQARAAITDLLAPGHVVELDLAGVSFMDSAGARLLLWAGEHARARGARVVLTAMSTPAQRLLVLARADRDVRGSCTWMLAG